MEEEIKYKKMVIDIPDKTIVVSVVSVVENGCQMVMSTHAYGTKDVEERKVKADL